MEQKTLSAYSSVEERDKVAMTKACEKLEASMGELCAPNEAFVLFCGFVAIERQRGRQARENVPKIVPLELGLERTKTFKERRIGKEISGRGKRI